MLALPAALRADSCTSASNLVQNCSFSTGDFTDWNVTYAATGSNLVVWHFGYNGDNAAMFYDQDSEYDSISQTLTTTSAAKYTLTFWLSDAIGDGPDSGTDFQALWDGTLLLDQNTTPTRRPSLPLL